jgi:Tfp pilus assembly pilus retraction ATPase PilT
VLRLLRKGAERMDIDDLGFDETQRDFFMRSLSRSQGMILLTGPTGSGKTTTLYAGLAELAAPIRNVVTLEDPVEYQLTGVNQTQTQPKIGMTFAAGLRTILRQDPDVIMVGEIRDSETAKLAVESSFTGHLVLSTLHTNDSPSTIARLAELGVERFLLATTLTLIVAQRLARTVCPGCSEPYEPSADVLEQMGLQPVDLQGHDVRRGAGCGRCDGTGYRGRMGMYEFLYVTPRLRQLISDGGTELQLAALARAEGLVSLRRDGIRKVLEGRTTFEEVLRTTPEDQFLTPRTSDGEHTEGGTSPEQERAIQVGAMDSARLLVAGHQDLLAEAKRALPPGWRMSTATSVHEALSRARTEGPDLLLLDHHLNDGTAFDVLRPLRESDHDTTPAVIWRRDGMDSDELLDASVLGVTDHIEGEVDPSELRARLEAALPH